MNWFQVFTQHIEYDAGRFVCPIEINALSPREAARERFERLSAPSKTNTCALLVVDGSSAWVFPVGVFTARGIAAEPLHVGAQEASP